MLTRVITFNYDILTKGEKKQSKEKCLQPLVWSCFSLSYSSDRLSCHARPRISFIFTVRYSAEFQKKERASIKNTYWRARWKTLAKLENPHLLCSQHDVPALTCRPTGHNFTYHPLDHLAHRRRPGQWMFWTLVDNCVVQTRPATEACNVKSRGATQVLNHPACWSCQNDPFYHTDTLALVTTNDKKLFCSTLLDLSSCLIKWIASLVQILYAK